MNEQMQVGRELDALIERRVFGGSPVQRAVWDSPDCIYDYTNDPEREDADLDWVRLDEQGRVTERVPAYSSEMAAAWPVAEKLQLAVLPVVKDTGLVGYLAGRFDGYLDEDTGIIDGRLEIRCRDAFAFADTAALAVCLAALKVVGQK